MKNESTNSRIARNKDFTVRLNEACDTHNVPPLNAGRLTWFKNQFQSQFNEMITVETVRKWFHGEARPRPDKMEKIAHLLKVELPWLSLGHDTGLGLKERAVQKKRASGTSNLVMGIIQISNFAIALPKANSLEDFTAIIDEQKFDIYTSLGIKHRDNSFTFSMPVKHEDLCIIGVAMLGSVHFDLLKISNDLIFKHAITRGNNLEIIIHSIGNIYKCGPDEVQLITNIQQISGE